MTEIQGLPAGAGADIMRDDYATPELVEYPPLTDVTGVTGDTEL